MSARIRLARVNKPERVFVEQTLVREDDREVVTRTEPTDESALEFSRACQASGWIEEGAIIRMIEKHLYYQEWFDIMALFDSDGKPLGWYCDIATPLRKVDGAYFLRDLLLDLWIWPDGRVLELDWDEFEEAFRQGWISEAEHEQAKATLKRLVDETRAGSFPHQYL